MDPVQYTTLGGGCFWCLEAVYERVRGVVSVESGYAGGRRPNPTYAQVSTGSTGHAEVIRVGFAPAIVTFDELLELFFAFHDPTTRDRQGPDTGTQYRSIILAESDEQERSARAVIAGLEQEAVFAQPIVTEVRRLEAFWPAEAAHRSYYRQHPEQAYCRAVIAPKVAKLRQKYADRLAR